MKSTNRMFTFGLTVVAIAAMFSVVAAQPTAPAARAVRVGTYDSRAVAVAAIRSGAGNSQLQQLQTQLKEAEAAKDTARAERIKKRGSQLQTLRHMQGFSIAPVDDLLANVKDKLARIAQAADVDVIVPRTDFASPNVQAVDVTEAMVKLFNPDAKTLEIVASLKNQKPISLADALAIEE